MKMIPETMINQPIGWILLAAALVLAGGCSRSKGNAASRPCEEILLGEFEERSFDSYLEARREQVTVVRLDSSLVLDSGRGLAGPDGKMLVADRKMRQLTVLSLLDGRRLGAVGAFGRAENEYLQVTGFDFDSDGNIWLLDADGTPMKQYRFHFGKYRIPDEVRSSISAQVGDFERYRCVGAPVYVSELTACGQLFDRGAYSFFLADRKEKVLYIPREHPESISLLDCGNGRMYLFLDGLSDSPYRSALGLSPSDGDCIAILRLTE